MSDYDYLAEIAERNKLCVNCLHTLACCDGKCPALDEIDPWTHECARPTATIFDYIPELA